MSRDVLLESIGKLQRQIIKENIPIFSFQKDLSIILNIAADNSFSDELVPIESLAHEYLSLLRDYYFDIFTKRLSEATLDIEAEKGLSTNITAYHESIWRAYIDISGHCLREFEVAKNSSLPSSPICDSWYTQVGVIIDQHTIIAIRKNFIYVYFCDQGYLIELMDDMKSHVSSVIPFPASIELPYASAQSDGDGSAYSNLTPSVHVQSKRSRSAWWTRVKRRFQQKHKRVVKYGKWLAVQMLLFLINFGQNELVCDCTYLIAFTMIITL